MTILDLIEQQIGSAQADHLGQQVGLAPAQAHSVVRALLPLQLGALIDHAQTPAGAQQLLDLAASTPGGTVHEILSRPGSAEQLEGLGNTLSPTLLGNQEHHLADQVAAHSSSTDSGGGGGGGAIDSVQVQRLGRLTLPLLLGLVGQWASSQNLGAAGLGAAMTPLRPRLAGLIPPSLTGLLGGLGAAGLGAVGGLAGAAGAALGAVRSGIPDINLPNVNLPNINVPNMPNLNVPNLNVPSINVPNVNVPDIKLPSGNLPSVDLPSVNVPSVNMSKISTPGVAAPGISATSRPLSTPLPNPSSLNAAPLVGETQRRGAGWLWALPLALLLGLGGCYLSQQNQAKPATTAGTTPTESTTAPVAGAAGTLAILAPATGGTVAAGAFDLSGTGKAGDELEVFEDGTSLGKATVGADGKWTLNVPSPAEGKHTYEVKMGALSATSAVTVGSAAATGTAAAGTAATGACTKDYTLSLKDGESVSAPFRFGGVGAGKGYNVSVMRGGRTIGTKPLPLNASCGWSYNSTPGKGKVTYIVKEGLEAAGKQVSSITLNVQ
ncbi:DUF937 domain-containing protein [Deinococcus sp.]|uniref:DUF937 domain-containing protein n=1 Tax=Deinococcus sp. TaxID=47478 RepID=UPI0025EA1B48|nr:DUF937 domain-containing protein [Deinococcus sp.]